MDTSEVEVQESMKASYATAHPVSEYSKGWVDGFTAGEKAGAIRAVQEPSDTELDDALKNITPCPTTK